MHVSRIARCRQRGRPQQEDQQQQQRRTPCQRLCHSCANVWMVDFVVARHHLLDRGANKEVLVVLVIAHHHAQQGGARARRLRCELAGAGEDCLDTTRSGAYAANLGQVHTIVQRKLLLVVSPEGVQVEAHIVIRAVQCTDQYWRTDHEADRDSDRSVRRHTYTAVLYYILKRSAERCTPSTYVYHRLVLYTETVCRTVYDRKSTG